MGSFLRRNTDQSPCKTCGQTHDWLSRRCVPVTFEIERVLEEGTL